MNVKKMRTCQQFALVLNVFVSLKKQLKKIIKMKNLFGPLILCFVAFSLNAQIQVIASSESKKTTEISSANPTMAVSLAEDVLALKEIEYDFGKIPQGKTVTHNFNVENKSKDSLKIINIQASCGCTTPDWERNKVQAPNEKTAVTVGYNAATEGPFTKIITITYNGTLTRQITIKGEVWKTPATSAPENKELVNLKDL